MRLVGFVIEIRAFRHLGLLLKLNPFDVANQSGLIACSSRENVELSQFEVEA